MVRKPCGLVLINISGATETDLVSDCGFCLEKKKNNKVYNNNIKKKKYKNNNNKKILPLQVNFNKYRNKKENTNRQIKHNKQ